MRLKLILHYAFSFFAACLLLVVVNVFYMRSQVYTESTLYHYSPDQVFDEVLSAISIDALGKPLLSKEVEGSLANKGIGVQFLDASLNVIYSLNTPEGMGTRHSAASLVRLYEKEDQTLFIEAFDLSGESYSALIFMSASDVKRTLYTYDVKKVQNAYNLFWLVGMNVLLLFMVSVIYTRSVTAPIYHIIQRISDLHLGHYHTKSVKKGLFYEVEENLNRLGRRLDAQEKARTEWVANLSHDIKTPLTSIMGHAALMGDTDFELPDAERAERCAAIVQKGKYISELVSDLNLSAQLSGGAVALTLKPTRLCPIIKEALTQVSGDVVLSCEAPDLEALLEASLFKRAIINLVNNAFVHNAQKIRVWVSVVSNEDEGVAVVIEDNGIGVEESALERLFTRYYRGGNTKTNPSGTGLGMAIARESILAMNGQIQAKKSEKGGLCITITLNLKQTQ